MNNEERESLINKWNFENAPVISSDFPGPIALDIFSRSRDLETPQTAFDSVLPLVPAEAKGAVLKDVDGNYLIDFCASIAVVNVGHQHPKVVEAIKGQAERLGHIFDMPTQVKLDVMDKLRKTAPDGLRDHCFITFTLSGTDAACAAVKQIRKITGRKQLIAFSGGYHGVFGSALAMTTGDQYRTGYGPLEDQSPISSKKMVPPFALSNRPRFSEKAPVKAAFSCPNSSLSISDGEMFQGV